MTDKAHDQTDELLAEMEAHLAGIYEQAQSEIEQKVDEYFRQFEKADEKKKKQVEDGELDEDEYILWRKNKMLYGKRWTNLKARISEAYLNVNKTAAAYINGKLPAVYALNFNSAIKTIGSAASGYSFDLVDAHTVKNLATSNKTLLPYKYVDGVKDVRWNTQKVNSAVLQGVLQGDSMPKIAKRLQSVTDMNKTSAIRNARTSVTGAECKGRQDSYEQAQKDGIELQREWIATKDYRTRHSHIMLDGQLVGVDEPFKSEFGDIMYPGDPTARPENVYNCRCTVAAKVISVNGNKISNRTAKADRATAQDLYEKDPKEFDIRQKMLYNREADKKQFERYKKRLDKDVPNNFSNFQDLKYRNKEKYNYVAGYFRYKGNNPRSGKEFYDANLAMKKLKEQGKIKSTGTLVAPTIKIKITSANDHALKRQKERSISIKRAQKIVDNSFFAIKQRKGKQYAYYNSDGMAVVSLDGKLGTVGRLDEGGTILYNEVIKYV